MIDRDARNEALHAINEYMDYQSGELRLAEIAGKTCDPTVRCVEEWTDAGMNTGIPCRLAVDRDDWKRLNRFRLLLASDVEIEEDVEKRFGVRQIIAILAVPCVWYALYRLFWVGDRTAMEPAIVLSGAVVCFGLYCWKERSERVAKETEGKRKPLNGRNDETAFPFDSFGEMLGVRRSVVDFRFKHYPEKVVDKRPYYWKWMDFQFRLGPRWLEKTVLTPFAVIYAVVAVCTIFGLKSPFYLIYQSLPETRRETRLRLPERTG